jgi:hypothetical protein
VFHARGGGWGCTKRRARGTDVRRALGMESTRAGRRLATGERNALHHRPGGPWPT